MCQTFGYNNQQQTQQNRQQGHPVFPTTQQFRMPMRPSSGSGTFRGGRVAELDAAVEPLNMSHVWWLNMVKLSEPPIFDVQKSYVFFSGSGPVSLSMPSRKRAWLQRRGRSNRNGDIDIPFGCLT